MSLIEDKREIHGKISALRLSSEGFPKLNISDSLCSIDNSTNPLHFLIDLLKVTVGFDELNSILSNTITYKLDDIELSIKKTLKKTLKSLISCGVNPSIPQSLLHQSINPQSSGVDLDLRKIDYMGMMLIDPTSDAGKLTYDNPSGGLNSIDIHTYLYETIQLDGTQTNWGSQNINNDVLSIEFNSIGTPSNMLNIKASQFYSDPANNKKLLDLNNDYLDSISLFGSASMINSLIDSIFGTITLTVNKTDEQIKQEVEIEQVIECLLNIDDNQVVDDSYFSFSNEDIRLRDEIISKRKNGIKSLKNCGNTTSKVPLNTLLNITDNINNQNNPLSKNEVITNAINDIASDAAQNVDDKNKITAKLSFIDDAIKKLMVKIGTVIVSPKVMIIFAINHNIIHGTNIDNPLEWIKNNKTLMMDVLLSIRDVIIKTLLEEAIKSIKTLVTKSAQEVITEKAKLNSAQLASLLGIPSETLRMIQGLG